MAGGGKGLFLTHSTDRKPEVAGFFLHHLVVRFEAEAPRVVRTVRVERTRPIVATSPVEVGRITIVVAGGGKKETVAVNGSEK